MLFLKPIKADDYKRRLPQGGLFYFLHAFKGASKDIGFLCVSMMGIMNYTTTAPRVQFF